MYLKRSGNANLKPITEVVVEKMGEKFVLVTIKNNYEDKDLLNDSPYYWRLVMESINPPLEISLNRESGQIQEITFFISEEDINEKQELSCKKINENTLIDTDLFVEYNYYNDTEGKYSVYFENRSLVCIFDNQIPSNISISNENISYLFNDKGNLIGFLVNNLNTTALDVLKESSLLI